MLMIFVKSVFPDTNQLFRYLVFIFATRFFFIIFFILFNITFMPER